MLQIICKEFADLGFGAVYTALLEDGLATAPTAQGLGHGLAQGTEVAGAGHQAEAVTFFVSAGENGRGAGDFAGDHVR